MWSYKRAFEDQKYRNRILEMRYRGEIAELQEREAERAKAVDLLIDALTHEQRVSKQNMEMYIDAMGKCKTLERELREAQWRNAKLEREIAKLRGETNEKTAEK